MNILQSKLIQSILNDDKLPVIETDISISKQTLVYLGLMFFMVGLSLILANNIVKKIA